jgi:hypothetical protein
MAASVAMLKALPLVLVVAACGGYDAPTIYEPITDPAQLYVALTLDHGAINLSTAAPYNTLQLTATPRNALGQPLTGFAAPTFRSTQPLRVRVAHDGRVEALQTGTGILVIAELAVEGNVRHADTARINVTATASPPVLDRLELDPVPPDSAVRWLDPSVLFGLYFAVLRIGGIAIEPTPITARALDAAGNAITGLQFEYQSLDPATARLPQDGGVAETVRLGQARIVARTTAYGVSKADTVTFTIKPPVIQAIILHPAAAGAGGIEPSDALVQPNGFVFWTNLSGQTADVTFDDPTNVTEVSAAIRDVATNLGNRPDIGSGGAGNITAFEYTGGTFAGAAARVRQFPVPGVYPYRNTVTGATGRIIVTDH